MNINIKRKDEFISYPKEFSGDRINTIFSPLPTTNLLIKDLQAIKLIEYFFDSRLNRRGNVYITNKPLDIGQTNKVEDGKLPIRTFSDSKIGTKDIEPVIKHKRKRRIALNNILLGKPIIKHNSKTINISFSIYVEDIKQDNVIDTSISTRSNYLDNIGRHSGTSHLFENPQPMEGYINPLKKNIQKTWANLLFVLITDKPSIKNSVGKPKMLVLTDYLEKLYSTYISQASLATETPDIRTEQISMVIEQRALPYKTLSNISFKPIDPEYRTKDIKRIVEFVPVKLKYRYLDPTMVVKQMGIFLKKGRIQSNLIKFRNSLLLVRGLLRERLIRNTIFESTNTSKLTQVINISNSTHKNTGSGGILSRLNDKYFSGFRFKIKGRYSRGSGAGRSQRTTFRSGISFFNQSDKFIKNDTFYKGNIPPNLHFNQAPVLTRKGVSNVKLFFYT